MEWTRTIGWAITVLLVGMTAAPLLPVQVWFVRVWEFPRVQILVVTAFGLLACGWLLRPLQGRSLAAVLLLLACVVWQAAKILPYTPLWPVESEEAEQDSEGERVRILISNVLMENRESGSLRNLVSEQNPDLLLLMEVDEWWLESLSPVTSGFDYGVEEPLDNMYGIALYSRLPLEQPEIRFLVHEETPSVRSVVRLPSGRSFLFYGLHPEPPAPTGAFTSAKRDAELVVAAKEMESVETPAVVAGDLNDVAWSHTTRLFRSLSGCLDPRVGRGSFGTFHADYPLLRYPLDHLFHSPHWRLVEIRVLPHIGSDHFPVFAELQLEPERKEEQAPPPADREEREQGEELIEQAEDEKENEIEGQG